MSELRMLLSKTSMPELKKQLKEVGVKGYSKMKKADLVELLHTHKIHNIPKPEPLSEPKPEPEPVKATKTKKVKPEPVLEPEPIKATKTKKVKATEEHPSKQPLSVARNGNKKILKIKI